MCGIVGVFGGAVDVGLLQRMTECIAHRGPDDEGVSELRDASQAPAGAIGQRRLAIIDISAGGHQPMFANDGRYAIVFNGEIYNYRQLRETLEREGARFCTQSDTEVILHGLARHGQGFIGRLRGMFAFLHWDRDTRTATIARDRYGIKPMLYARLGDSVLFASELRALRTAGAVGNEIDAGALDAYLAWGAASEPATMLAGASSLPAGAVATLQVVDGRASDPTVVARFLPLEPHDGEPERDGRAAAELIVGALRESVREHLVADVPVAAFLSGGIDSSIICALASEENRRPLDTFTVVFGERELDESAYAREVARGLGTVHHEIPLRARDFLASLDEAFGAMDQPSLDGLNTYVVSRAVRAAGFKVVLSGLGGDEMFAGYPSFRRARALARGWPVLRAARPFAAALGESGIRAAKAAAMLGVRTPAAAAYVGSRLLFPSGEAQALSGRSGRIELEEPPPGLSLLQEVSWYELTGYMRNVLLRDSDIFSMAHAVELRVPFVDVGVARASLSVADELKLAPGRSKPLLIAALRDRLPRGVWDRPKRGFALPFDRWMRATLRGEVGTALSNPVRLARVGLDPRATAEVWRRFLENRGVSWSRPWTLYTLVRWAESLDVGTAMPSRTQRVMAD